MVQFVSQTITYFIFGSFMLLQGYPLKGGAP